MSHFTVLVIGDDVEGQLAPYHEFECTGINDEYVQDVDETEEYRESYEKKTTKRYRDPEGSLYKPYEDRFYRNPTEEEQKIIGPISGTGCGKGISWTTKNWGDGRGYRAKVHFLPEGWTEVELPVREVFSFAEYIEYQTSRKVARVGSELDMEKEHKYGYTLVDKEGNVVKTIDRTNPQKRWDWYQVGGRWTGYFKMKPGKSGEVGSPGLGTSGAKPGYADSARKGDIDIDAMQTEHVAEQLGYYDQFWAIVGDRKVPNWEAIVQKHNEDCDAARKEYNSNEVIIDLNKSSFWYDIQQWVCPRDEFEKRAYEGAISTLAIVKDGKWYERGEMGWWGVVHDEKPQDDWNAEFNKLLDELPDDTLLTVVDCHI